MKRRGRSATYTPISLPNERTSRTQVKNELAPRNALREREREKKMWFHLLPRKTAHVPTCYYSPPPPPPLNCDFSGDDWLNWKQLATSTPQHPQTPILPTAASNLVGWVAAAAAYSFMISPTAARQVVQQRILRGNDWRSGVGWLSVCRAEHTLSHQNAVFPKPKHCQARLGLFAA